MLNFVNNDLNNDYLKLHGGICLDNIYKGIEYCKNFEVALDCGAYIGYYTIPLAKKFKKVLAFELVPETYKVLQTNVFELQNVQTFNKAVSNELGKTDWDFHENKAGVYSSCMMTTGTSVNVITIDSLNLEKCDFIKIDTEGNDYNVLLGAIKTIEKFKPVIMIELKEYLLEKFNHTRKHIHKLLKKDYRYRRIYIGNADYIYLCE